MEYNCLPQIFFARDTHVVAKELLGKLLVREFRGTTIVGRITETESYVGEDDLACHASKGRTKRTEVMYGKPGHAYVYLIYGMYDMFNVVTDRKNFPAAVLIRGLEPIMNITRSVDGPGKLTRALHVTRSLNKLPLFERNKLFIADDNFVVDSSLVTNTKRVGVDYAKHCADYLWRYVYSK